VVRGLRRTVIGTVIGTMALLMPAHVATSSASVRAVDAQVAPRTALVCHTYVSNQYPKPRSKVLVYVHSSPKVSVRSSAAFKNSTVVHQATGNKYGNATHIYEVGRAPKGFTVRVTVLVTHDGAHAACHTHFTPK